MKNKQLVFLVDDDPLFLKSLEIEFLNLEGIETMTFSTGEICIENLKLNPVLIILDYHLNGIDKSAINGIETLDRIKKINYNIPVIILSSQDKIEVAVDCMNHHAENYVVKSETAFIRITKIMEAIFANQKILGELKWYMTKMK